MKKKHNKNKIPLPEIDGKLLPGYFYMCCSARINNGTILLSKSVMKTRFKARFGYDPETVFYGDPNGSAIYAGPVYQTK